MQRLEKVIQDAKGNSDGIDELVASGIEKFQSMQQDNDGLENAMKDNAKVQNEALFDFFHKESVKVYRNVQAVTLEEIAKQTETLDGELKAIKSKVTLAVVVSFLAVAAAVANLVITILK